MKLFNHIYMVLAIFATFLMAACSPDDLSMGGKSYSPEELVEGKAYTVTINGNVVTLTSNIPDCTALWVTPSGRSQKPVLKLELPFAGDYEVTFGVETNGGVVYGEPYKFNLPQNDFSLLNDNKWFYLADQNYKGGQFPDAETLAAGVKKRWIPCYASFGIGQCSGPVMYALPYDPDGDGKGFTEDDKLGNVYKDILFENFKPNYDPGFQNWLIPETDPYMDSYMEFSMDAKNGCVATMYRGEAGTKGASTGSNLIGKFNMNLEEKTMPKISFSDCYAMHNVGFDEVCSNYTQDISIVELTPYMLQLATRRTNSEGNWYIIWNFVSEEVKTTNGKCIPAADKLLDVVSPKLPEYPNLATDLFTIEHNDVSYVGNKATFVLDSEKPYDILWWNNSPFKYDTSNTNGVPSKQEMAVQNAARWKSVIGDKYNNTWAPKPADAVVDNFQLSIEKITGQDFYKFTCTDCEGQELEGRMEIKDGNKLVFNKYINIIAASSDKRTIKLRTREFTVLGEDAAGQLMIGVPEAKDADGNVNTYLVACLNHKAIGGGQTGPTIVGIDATKIPSKMWVENGCLRLGFWHYGTSGSGIFKDEIGKIKLKKNQTITVVFKVSGVTWDKTPKCALITDNKTIGGIWEPKRFEQSDVVELNTNGETTVSLTNTSGSTVTFTDTCLDLSIQLNGYGGTWPDYTDVSSLGIEIVSCTIQ